MKSKKNLTWWFHPRFEKWGGTTNARFESQLANRVDHQLSQRDVHEAVRVPILEPESVVDRHHLADDVLLEVAESGGTAQHQLDVLNKTIGSSDFISILKICSRVLFYWNSSYFVA